MENYQKYVEQMWHGFDAIRSIATIKYEYNPRELVFTCDKVQLYHYRSLDKKKSQTPLLIVFATVNRPEILDLIPSESFIGRLLQNGIDVYLLDWGRPDADDANIRFADYVATYLNKCVGFIAKASRSEKINLLGICQGGVISVCYAALYPKIKNLILISTPIDFQTHDNTIAKLLTNFLVTNNGEQIKNIPGSWLTQFFISLRPFDLLGKKYLYFTDHISDKKRTEKFLRVEKWLYDAPDQPGFAFNEFIDELYRANKLITGSLRLGNKKVDLSKLSLPILNIIASEDEIIPPSASYALKKYVGSSDYSQRTFAGGHIGIYVSERVGKRLPNAIAAWLKKRD